MWAAIDSAGRSRKMCSDRTAYGKSGLCGLQSEYMIYTGNSMEGKSRCVSTGIRRTVRDRYEELANLGVHTFIRVGTCEDRSGRALRRSNEWHRGCEDGRNQQGICADEVSGGSRFSGTLCCEAALVFRRSTTSAWFSGKDSFTVSILRNECRYPMEMEQMESMEEVGSSGV